MVARLGRLRQQRQWQYLSVRELAAKAGVSVSTVIAVESGRVRPHPRTIRKLAEALSVRPDVLVTREE